MGMSLMGMKALIKKNSVFQSHADGGEDGRGARHMVVS